MLGFPFLIMEQHTTFKESIINRLSNLINRNHSVLCSNIYMLMVMMIVLIVVPMALNMTITTWWQRCWWQWQEWVLNRPNLSSQHTCGHAASLSSLLHFFLSLSLNLRLCGIFVTCPQYSQKTWAMVNFLWRLSFFQNDAITMFLWHTPPLLSLCFFGFFKSNAQYFCP